MDGNKLVFQYYFYLKKINMFYSYLFVGESYDQIINIWAVLHSVYIADLDSLGLYYSNFFQEYIVELYSWLNTCLGGM